MTRLGAAAIALLALILAFLAYHHFYGKSRYKAGYTAAEAAMQSRVDEANRQAIATEKAAQGRVDTLEKSHAEAITDLDARLAAALAKPPRVQKCASGSGLPQTPTDASSGHGGEVRSGHVPADAGSDIGPGLVLYGRDAEALRLTLIACKAYGAEIERFRETLNQP